MLNEQQFYLFGQIQTNQTGGQLYSDTFPYGECSLAWDMFPKQPQGVSLLPLIPWIRLGGSILLEDLCCDFTILGLTSTWNF